MKALISRIHVPASRPSKGNSSHTKAPLGLVCLMVYLSRDTGPNLKKKKKKERKKKKKKIERNLERITLELN